MADLIHVASNIIAGVIGGVIAYWIVRSQDDIVKDRYARLQELNEALDAHMEQIHEELRERGRNFSEGAGGER